MDYRIKTDYEIARLPKIFIEEKRSKCSPCSTCNQLVLASLDSNDSHKNDKKGVFLKKTYDLDTIDFVIEFNGAVIPNLGEAVTFPEDSLTVGYVFDWKQFLQTTGVGCYVIKCNFNIAGIDGSYTIGIYDLKNYSVSNAKSTVRIWSKFRSYSLSNSVDFTNSNFQDMIRFKGFFGNRTPETEISNLVSKGRKVEKVTRENLNKYELRSNPLNECRTKQLLDFHFLHEDFMYISDHNSKNHSYDYFDKSVVLVDAPSIEYTDGDRMAKVTAYFGDKVLNKKSMYNVK
jgi:hypothetical protein